MAIDLIVTESYRKYKRDIAYRIISIYNQALTPQDVEDIVMTCFEKLFIELSNGKKITNIGGWLIRVAKNSAIDRVRSLRFKWDKEKDELEKNFQLQNKSDELDFDNFQQDSKSHDYTDVILIIDCVKKYTKDFCKLYPERAFIVKKFLQFEENINEELKKVIDRSDHAAEEYISKTIIKFRSFLKPCQEI